MLILLITFPYGRLYDKTIQNVAAKRGIKLKYEIEKASLFSLKIKDMFINNGKYNIHFSKISAKIFPVNYFRGKKFAYLEVFEKDQRAILAIKRIEPLKWQINSIIPVSMLKYLPEGIPQTVISSLKGEVYLNAWLKKDKDRIEIQKLTTEGAVNISAKGYIKDEKIKLAGLFKLGNFQQKFTFAFGK